MRNSSERLYSVFGGGGIDGDILITTPRRPIIIGIPNDNVVDDGLTVVRTIHIGCKGEGLPKSSVVWYQQVGSAPDFDSPDLDEVAVPMNLINDTERDDVMITVPREGRSILSIELDPTDTVCQRYVCEASNLAGTVRGGIDVCPERKFSDDFASDLHHRTLPLSLSLSLSLSLTHTLYLRLLL